MKTKTILIAVAALFSAQTAAADGPYYGVGAALYSATSNQAAGSSNESSDSYGALGLTVGYRWDQPTSFYGAEADFDLPLSTDFENSATGANCKTNASGPYYCTHNGTLRLRGIAGGQVGGFEGFASAGLVVMTGDGAVNTALQDTGVNTGFTIGFGLQQDLGGNMLRYEVIYDNAETTATKPNGIYEPTFEAISAKVTYLFN